MEGHHCVVWKALPNLVVAILRLNKKTWEILQRKTGMSRLELWSWLGIPSMEYDKVRCVSGERKTDYNSLQQQEATHKQQ